MPVAKWIRVRFDNKLIANSRHVMLKRGFPLFYYFLVEDVDQDLLENSDRSEKDDRGKKVFYHVKSGERQQDNASWVYEKPSDEAPENLENYIAFEWKAMDSLAGRG